MPEALKLGAYSGLGDYRVSQIDDIWLSSNSYGVDVPALPRWWVLRETDRTENAALTGLHQPYKRSPKREASISPRFDPIYESRAPLP